ERYRAPLVLCCLEGTTRDEAAQQLGWSVATLKGRLERGRALLALRLRRRGLTLSAALAGLTISESAAEAAVPAALLTSTVTAARFADTVAPGVVSAQALLLARGMVRAMLFAQLKAALGVVVAAVFVAGLGAAVLWLAAPPDRVANAGAQEAS